MHRDLQRREFAHSWGQPRRPRAAALLMGGTCGVLLLALAVALALGWGG